MPSKRRPALLPTLLLSFGMLCEGGCVSTPPTTAILAALDCSSQIPSLYRQPCKPTSLPTPSTDPATGKPTITGGQAATFGDGQTSALQTCDVVRSSVVEIADKCQARQAAVLQALQPPKKLLGIF